MSRITNFANGQQTCKYWVQTIAGRGQQESLVSCICTGCNELYEYNIPHQSDDLPNITHDIIGAVNSLQDAIARCTCRPEPEISFRVTPSEIQTTPGSLNWVNENYSVIREASIESLRGNLTLDAVESAQRMINENNLAPTPTATEALESTRWNTNYNIGIDLGSGLRDDEDTPPDDGR